MPFLATRALLAQGQFVVHQHSQVLLHRAASQQVNPLSVVVHGVIPPQVQDPALAFAEFQKDLLCPPVQSVEVLLQGCTALWGISHSSQLAVTSELAEEGSAPSSKALMNKVKNTELSTEH